MMHYLAFTVVSVIHLIACVKGKQKLRHVSKCFLMPMLFLAYIMQGCRVYTVMAGMVFGLIGDIVLIRANEYKFRVAGSTFFALGHICYLYSLLFTQGTVPGGWTYFVFPAAFILVMIVIYNIIKQPVDKSMRLQVLGYFLLLGVMAGVSAAVAVADTHYGSLAGLCSLLGYIFFIASDSMLVTQWFTVGDPHPSSDLKVMLTYCLAQLLITLGFII